MKLAVIALCTAAVMASAPAVFAQAASDKTPGHEMQKAGKKAGHHSSYAARRRVQANRSKTGYPGAYVSAPVEVRDITDIATKGGGGGGGGGY